MNYPFPLCNWPIGKVFPNTMYKLQQGLHFISYFVNLALKTQINKYLNYSIVKCEPKLVTQVSWFFWGFANKENAKTSPFPKPIGIWKLSHWYFSKISLHLLAIVTLLHFFLPLSIIVINWKIASFRESWFIFFPLKIASLVLWTIWGAVISDSPCPLSWTVSLIHWCSIWKFKCPVNQSLKKDCSTLQVAKTCRENLTLDVNQPMPNKRLLLFYLSSIQQVLIEYIYCVTNHEG